MHMGTNETFDPSAFEFAMRQITDGNVFERFGQDLFCQILGYNFVTLGGHHDRGIDGLDRCFKFLPKRRYSNSRSKRIREARSVRP